MRKYVITIAFVFFCMLLSASNDNRILSGRNIADEYCIQDSLDSIFKDWRKDTTGCLNLRENHVNTVIAFVKKKVRSYKQLLKCLGKPNIASSEKDVTNLVYYTSASCSNGMPDLSGEHCFLIISFVNKKSKAFNAFVECN